MSYGKSLLLQAINIVAFVCTLAVNALAGSTTLLNGRTSGMVSDLYPTFITPAGFTFAIWGIIYALLFVFTVFQVLPKNREKPFLFQVSFLFALAAVLNISWLFLWHYDFLVFSVVLIFALLATLIAIYLRLGIGKSAVSSKERLCVHLPFSVYLGWITVASIANVAVTLTAVGWDGWGVEPSTWAVLVICVALLITFAVLVTRRDVAYGLVIVWALAGILVKQAGNETVVFIAELGIALVLLASVVVAFVSRVKK
jgi:hypothetical protein